MSRAAATFDSSIEDAATLLAHFDSVHKAAPESAEVLKRAGLVMALTAWETYVEDRVVEAVQARLRVLEGSSVGKFVAGKLDEELKRFHNPTAEKTKRLFLDYLEIDVTSGWKWLNFDPATARKDTGRADFQAWRRRASSEVDERWSAGSAPGQARRP